MRILFWLVFLVMVFGILLWLIRREDLDVPHAIILKDSTEVRGMGPEGGNAPLLNSAEPTNMRYQEQEIFLGKAFADCMRTIYALPNSDIRLIQDDVDGVQMIEVQASKHHLLLFDNSICITDSILPLIPR